MNPQQHGRLAFLDVIRGFAALAVVVQHGLERVSPGYLAWSLHHLNLGAFGVVAFFLVSGFIIPYSLERSGSLRAFWLGRFFRLFPLYWASLAAALTLHVTGWATIPGVTSLNLAKVAAANATMFQEAFRQPHAIGVYWTLSLEMGFYVLCAALFFLGWNRRSLLWAWLSLAAVVLGTVGAAVGLHRDLPAGRLGLIVTAFIGTACCRAFTGALHRRRLAPLLAAVGVGLGACFYLHFDRLASADRTLDWSFGAVFASWLLAYLFFFATYAARERVFPGALRWLGQVSYSLYLVHPLLLDALPRVGPAPMQLALFLATTVTVSWATYTWIERPFISLGKRLAAGSPVPTPEVAA
jgi:peptidoglycan/LPS O-acetylase OafA/YrhL